MKKDISNYFWNLNKRALAETELILRNPSHPKFAQRLILFLSRCQEPKKLFSIVSKNVFIEAWPKIRSYWAKIERDSEFRSWWQTVYEQIAREQRVIKKMSKGNPPALFLAFGRMVKDSRIKMGLSQAELAIKIGMRQPDISKIEEGKTNITLETLSILCKALGIKKLILE